MFQEQMSWKKYLISNRQHCVFGTLVLTHCLISIIYLFIYLVLQGWTFLNLYLTDTLL